jgi:hypothetical protein
MEDGDMNPTVDMDTCSVDRALQDVYEWCGYQNQGQYLDDLPVLKQKIFPKD